MAFLQLIIKSVGHPITNYIIILEINVIICMEIIQEEVGNPEKYFYNTLEEFKVLIRLGTLFYEPNLYSL